VTIKTALNSVKKHVAVICNYIQQKGAPVMSYWNSILNTLIKGATTDELHNTDSNDSHDESISVLLIVDKEEEAIIDCTSMPVDEQRGPFLVPDHYGKGIDYQPLGFFCQYSKLILVWLLTAGIIALTYYFMIHDQS